MSALLLAPHSDDEVLWCSWTICAHDPHVVVVLNSGDRRSQETDAALAELGVTDWTQWPYPETDPDWGAVENALRSYDDREKPETVFAPAAEDGGHEHHDMVARLAADVFGDRVTSYLTYRRGNGRSRSEREVPFEPVWVAWKLRALACYASQIQDPLTRPWFLDGGLREWYAE